MNKVFVAGNIGADPDHKVTQGGTHILKIRLASNDRKPDGNGGWKDHAEWHRCTLFGKRAEALSGILVKGAKVIIEGHLETTSYEKEGQKHYSTDIIVDEIELCDRAPAGQQQPAQQAPPAPHGAPPRAPPAPGRPPPRAPSPPQREPKVKMQSPDRNVPAGYVFRLDINDWEYRPDLNLPAGDVVDSRGVPLDIHGNPIDLPI